MTAPRKLILWDLDGTLCPHNPAFSELASLAVAEAALECDIPMHKTDAVIFARQSFKGQRACILAFAERFALDEEDLFRRYYARLQPGFLAAAPLLIHAFRQLTPHYACGVLTQAPENWAFKALTQLRLLPFFEESLIIGYHTLEGHRKTDAASVRLINTTLQQHGYSRSHVTLVDDKLSVLTRLENCAATRLWIADSPAPAILPSGIHTLATALEAAELLANQQVAAAFLQQEGLPAMMPPDQPPA